MLRSDNSTWAWPSPCFPVANTLVDWQVTTAYDQVEDRFAKLMHWWDWQSYAVCLPTVSNPPQTHVSQNTAILNKFAGLFWVRERVMFTQESSWWSLLSFSLCSAKGPSGSARRKGWRPAKNWWRQAVKANCSRNSWITQIGIYESMPLYGCFQE